MMTRISAKAVIIRDQAILLQECLIDGERRFLLPGGGQDFGEPLAETVRREVLEETGFRVRVDGVLWIREHIPVHRTGGGAVGHQIDVIFRCTPESDGTPEPISNADDSQIGVHWIPIADLPNLTMWPETVRDLLVAHGGNVGASDSIYLGNCP